jgi:hypothetical protein
LTVLLQAHCSSFLRCSFTLKWLCIIISISNGSSFGPATSSASFLSAKAHFLCCLNATHDRFTSSGQSSTEK